MTHFFLFLVLIFDIATSVRLQAAFGQKGKPPHDNTAEIMGNKGASKKKIKKIPFLNIAKKLHISFIVLHLFFCS